MHGTKRRKLREESEGEEEIRRLKRYEKTWGIKVGELDSRRIHPFLSPVFLCLHTLSLLFPRVLWQDIAIKELLVRVRTSTLDECERKLVILNWILRLSFLSVGCLRLRKLLQRCFKERSLASSSTVAFFFPSFLSSFSFSFRSFRRKIQIVLRIQRFFGWLFLCIYRD